MGPRRSAGIALETHPDQYQGRRLSITIAVAEEAPLVPGYKLKLNSYDLGVDIELADAVARLRFEHPEVRAVIITGDLDRVFAPLPTTATLPGRVQWSHCRRGYELALACEEIYLVDDGNSTVSLPEVTLLGVLPGTGGLTREVDKRKVRRDLADVFATLAEGIKGKRAVEWRLGARVSDQASALKTRTKRALWERGRQMCVGQSGIGTSSRRPTFPAAPRSSRNRSVVAHRSESISGIRSERYRKSVALAGSGQFSATAVEAPPRSL